jgi:hypothetical protein
VALNVDCGTVGKETGRGQSCHMLEFACGDVSQDSWSLGRLRYGIKCIAECYDVMSGKQVRDMLALVVADILWTKVYISGKP